MPSNLVLAGFMGTGKTTVGRIAAERLDMKFVDTDEEIERNVGKSVADIFSSEGEAAFRKMEEIICLQLAHVTGQVIAAGGGALVNDNIRRALTENSLLICLDSDLETVVRRLGSGSDRPLFRGNDTDLKRLYTERQKIYAIIPLHIDTTNSTPGEAAQQVIELWNRHS